MLPQHIGQWVKYYRQVKGFVLPAIEQINSEEQVGDRRFEKVKERV